MLVTQSGKYHWHDRVLKQYHQNRPVIFLFDYDGTLTPIVSHPSLAKLDESLRRTLTRLSQLPNVRIGVISGRSLDNVRSNVSIDSIYYAGSGGLEIDRITRVDRFPRIDQTGRLFDEIQDHIHGLLTKYPGTWIERKPGALSIHYRGLTGMIAAGFRYEIVNVLSALEELRVRVVSEAIEVTPLDGWHKGTAVEMIVSDVTAELNTKPFLVFFGDAPNDEEAMLTTRSLGGLTIGIGPDAPSCCDVEIDTPEELARDLSELVSQLSAAPEDQIVSRITAFDHEVISPASNDLANREMSKFGLLILDSDESSRQKLARNLISLGWLVWQANSSDHAQELIQEFGESIQVAMVDLQLPGLEGARVLAELGLQYPHLIRCFLSGNVSPYTAQAFSRLSDLPLFVKPVQAEALDREFRQLIHQRFNSSPDLAMRC